MNRPLFILLGVICSLLLALNGCASFRTDMGRSLPARTPEFTNQQTTVAAVMQEFGAPNTVGKLPNGFAFLYERLQLDEFQLGFSMDVPLIRYFKFVHAFNHLNQQGFLFTFDERGILQSTGSTQWKENLGGGNAVQFLFAAMSLSDSSRFRRPADVHAWGGELLQPPEVTLNAAQNLRTGENGLQQRIVPDYAGQQTLEMIKSKSEKEIRRTEKDYQGQSITP